MCEGGVYRCWWEWELCDRGVGGNGSCVNTGVSRNGPRELCERSVVWRDGVYGAACVAVNQCVKEVGCMG